jgi:hypothetical protein
MRRWIALVAIMTPPGAGLRQFLQQGITSLARPEEAVGHVDLSPNP